MKKVLLLFIFAGLNCLSGCDFICPETEEEKELSDSANVRKTAMPLPPPSQKVKYY